MFPHLMDHLKIARPGAGRPRTRPDRVRADKAYSSRAIRSHLRQCGIGAVIPQPSDQIGHRILRGSTGGRPPGFDRDDTRTATSSNATSPRSSNGAASRPAYDKLAITYRGGAVLRAITIWTKALGDTP